MYDGKVIYEVRADTGPLDGDLNDANSKVEKNGAKLRGLAKNTGIAIGGALVVAGGAALNFGSSFETAIAGASTLFGGMQVDTEGLNKKMLELSDSTGIAADELGNSLYNALSSGVPVSEDMGEATAYLEKAAKLAKAGFTDIDTASNATISTLNAYGASIEDTDKYQKILMQTQNKGKTTIGELGAVLSNVTPTAAAMGISFEQVGAGIANMTAKGTPAAQATTQLNSLFAELGKQGTQASDNLAKATEGTEYAGKSFQQLMKEGVPLNKVLDLMGGYADKNGLGMLDMFSSIDAGKGALLNSGENAEGFTDALAAMTTETDVVGDAFDKVSGTSAEKFNAIMNKLKNMAIDLFIKMMPLIELALPVLMNLFERLLPPIMQLTEKLMPILVSLFDTLLPPIIELIDLALPPLLELFDLLIPPLLELVSAIMPLLVGVFKALMPPIMELIHSLLPPLVDLFLVIGPLIASLMPVVTALADIFAGYLGGKVQYISGIVKGFSGILSGVIQFITGVFTGNWSKAWDGVVKTFKGIFNLIPSVVEGAINGAILTLNGLIKGVNKLSGVIGIKAIPEIGKVSIPRFKTGIDYVPTDYFPAYLDKGETVLTAEEAAAYRSLGGIYNIEHLLSYPSSGNTQSQPIIVYAGDMYLDGDKLSKSVTNRQYADAATRRMR